MPRSKPDLVLALKATLRRLVRFGGAVLVRHPRLERLARRILRVVPGAAPVARRLLAFFRNTSPMGLAGPAIPPFEPSPVEPGGIVTVEGLYHLSRALRSPE